VVLIGGLPLVGAATGNPAPQTLPPGATAAMVAAGKTVFDGPGACYTCHGQGGVGTGLAPNLTDATWLHSDGSFPAIEKTVNEGVAAPKAAIIPMLPKGGAQINAEQVKAVAAYVWTLSHK
jgi:mono/diheme cytochrome c family protein